MRNRFKGLDLIDRVPEELLTEVPDIVPETGIKAIPKKKQCKKAKWLSEEAFQIAVKRREAKNKGQKERYTHLNAEFQRLTRRDKKAFLKEQSVSSVSQFSCSVLSDSLRPHEPQQARPSCPSPTPRVYPNLCPLTRWCHPTTSSSVIAFSSCWQSFPASGSFQMSQLFTSGGHSIGVSLQQQYFQRIPRTDLL